MKPRDIFGIAVRVVGLGFVYHALMSIPSIFFGGFLVIPQVIFYLVVAWWLLGGAKLLMHHAYPEAPPPNPTDAPPVKGS